MEGLMLKPKLRYFGHLMWRADSLEKTLMLGNWRQEEKRVTEDEMAGWHHWLNGHEFEQIPEDSAGQGSLVFCSPLGPKESDTTEWLKNNRCNHEGPCKRGKNTKGGSRKWGDRRKRLTWDEEGIESQSVGGFRKLEKAREWISYRAVVGTQPCQHCDFSLVNHFRFLASRTVGE